MKTNLQKMNDLLKRGWINFALVRKGKEWIARTDKGEVLKGFCARPTKTALKDWLRSRYLAEVYTDTAHVNARWALKNPKFNGRFGALEELANMLK